MQLCGGRALAEFADNIFILIVKYKRSYTLFSPGAVLVPRDVEAKDFERLIEQIKLGEHSTLLVTTDGEVLGGKG